MLNPYYDEDNQTDKDLASVRVFQINAENEAAAVRVQPHGMWQIKLKRGILPKAFAGLYLSFEDAATAIERLKVEPIELEPRKRGRPPNPVYESA